ncbi:XK-related 7-like protein [Labeo rohita]|uniref:XK-related protein n=1 Tax=Labeo rohita TaxID=84645 RepID=A0A498LCQ0_LABRO|nr:XK-related protein 7 [Labeo rohita]RXN03085.1 XK-related 7-like protein [Labeo rohita]
MAAKSDGTAVSLQNDIPPTCLPGLEKRSPQWRPVGREYSLLDCCWTLCALLVFFSDGASDLWLAADYYLRRNYWWFALTLVFIIIPSVVVQVLSFRWFAYDYSDANGSGTAAAAMVAASNAESHFSTKDSDQRGAGRSAAVTGTRSSAESCCRACVWLFQSVVHVLQLAQVWRYVHALYLGVQSRWRGDHEHKHFYWRTMFENADISMLRLLETFLKSAPQLVLQLSIMVQAGQVLPLQGLSASASLVSLGWMMASYQKALRDSRDDKLPMSYKAVVVHMLWHLFTVGARAMAFALFVSIFQLYFGIFIVAHWCAMTFWIIQGETDFCMSKWEEIIYNMMVGIVYIFCWFSVREGPTRCRLLLYSLIILGENVALTAVWYIYRSPPTSDFYAVVVVCVVACSYALGTFFMFIYYCLLHPDGPVSGAYIGCCDVQVGAVSDPCVSSPTSAPPPLDAVSSPPRTLQRTKGGESVPGGDVGEVFKMRTLKASRTTAPRIAPRTEGPVIRIDLPRKQYPAWDAHFIDRRLRKTILVLEAAAPVTPRIQYRCLGTPKEVMEYETTV